VKQRFSMASAPKNAITKRERHQTTDDSEMAASNIGTSAARCNKQTRQFFNMH
jgi:hypothetical protein